MDESHLNPHQFADEVSPSVFPYGGMQRRLSPNTSFQLVHLKASLNSLNAQAEYYRLKSELVKRQIQLAQAEVNTLTGLN